MLIAAFFALWAAIGVMMLLPGAASLRLDENGFVVTRFFRKKSFRWSDVSDFGVVSFGQNGEVVGYRTAQPGLNIWDKINATLAGGRNGYLPDTYGMTVEDLAKLMTSWRNSATETADRTPAPEPITTACFVSGGGFSWLTPGRLVMTHPHEVSKRP